MGEGSCRKEAEGNEAEAAEKRGAPPLRHCVLRVPPPLPLQTLALPCLPALQPGRLGPAGPLGNSQWAVAHLGRGDAGSPLGTVSERSGLERALDCAGLAEGGLWLATASEASGPEDPWSERFSHPAEMVVLPRGSRAPIQQTSLYFQRARPPCHTHKSVDKWARSWETWIVILAQKEHIPLAGVRTGYKSPVVAGARA